MLESYEKIFELSISMVTALLGLAYPLLIDKIDDISSKYKSRRMSERFKREWAYRWFHILLVICIIQLFLIPCLLFFIVGGVWEHIILAFQGISVFVLTMIMVSVYRLFILYNDPELLRIRINKNDSIRERIADLTVLIEFSATDNRYSDLYSSCINDYSSIILEIQKDRL